MYLIDLDQNPYERTTCPDGGNHAACSNLYHHDAYADVREELEAIMETVSWAGGGGGFVGDEGFASWFCFFCFVVVRYLCDGNDMRRPRHNSPIVLPGKKKHTNFVCHLLNTLHQY